MNRRLYFLVPDPPHARQVVNGLEAKGIATDDIHTVAHDTALIRELPLATRNQRQDLGLRIERRLWNLNLAIFAVALVGLIIMLSQGAAV